jgi:hypothetical protein
VVHVSIIAAADRCAFALLLCTLLQIEIGVAGESFMRRQNLYSHAKNAL